MFPAFAAQWFDAQIEAKKDELRRARDRFHRLGQELVTLEKNRARIDYHNGVSYTDPDLAVVAVDKHLEVA